MENRSVKGPSYLLVQPCVGLERYRDSVWLEGDSFVHRDHPDERDDQVWTIPEAKLANLHNVVRISGGTVSMVHWPEDLVVVPR
jgi:hypothetical protein